MSTIYEINIAELTHDSEQPGSGPGWYGFVHYDSPFPHSVGAFHSVTHGPFDSLWELCAVLGGLALELSPHTGHGAGSEASGPDAPDCPCRTTDRFLACAAAGCGFCRAESAAIARAMGDPTSFRVEHGDVTAEQLRRAWSEGREVLTQHTPRGLSSGAILNGERVEPACCSVGERIARGESPPHVQHRLMCRAGKGANLAAAGMAEPRQPVTPVDLEDSIAASLRTCSCCGLLWRDCRCED